MNTLLPNSDPRVILKIDELTEKLAGLSLRLGELNIRVNTLEDLIDDMCSEQTERIRIPHRCPVCNGTTFDFEGSACPPCDGRGIVWG